MAKTTIKIADLAQLNRPVDVAEDQQILLRPLNLREIVQLFIDSREVFLPLYAAGLEGKMTAEAFAPFLISAPDVVARIIAMASDDPASAPVVEQRMAATVQLIALSEIWQMSVPDQKKAKQLLSEVTALLQKLSAESENAIQQTSSPTSLLPQ